MANSKFFEHKFYGVELLKVVKVYERMKDGGEKLIILYCKDICFYDVFTQEGKINFFTLSKVLLRKV